MNSDIKHIALLFGSFNPIHNGHLHLGEKVLDEMDIDEVWFVVSPQNPFKVNSNLLDENHRLKMLELSVKDNDNFKICDVEMSMDRPSYSYKTLQKLSELFPNYEFSFVIGSDAINQINGWRNSEEVLKYPIITFVRNDELVDASNIKSDKLTILKSDFDLSSTIIRNRIKRQEDLSGLTPDSVIEYINKNNLFTIN